MYNLLIGIMLLSPTEPPVPSQVPEALWQALKQVALKTEIVGPHERWGSDFRAELRYVRYHLRELADAPPLADSDFLPLGSVVARGLTFNLEYQRYVRMLRSLESHNQWYWQTVFEETRELQHIWDTMRIAQNPTDSFVARRRALKRLRETIGPDAYYQRMWPPYVPIWRFQELD